MSTEHGSARYMSDGEAHALGLINQGKFGDGEIYLGHIMNGELGKGDFVADPLQYTGDQHLVTVAPNRTGKGTSAIIPNLLLYTGSVLCIDPKGENAIVSAGRRRWFLDQQVEILDPWNIAVSVLNEKGGADGTGYGHDEKMAFKQAGFNPLDILHPDNPDLIDDARGVADSIVVPSHGDQHWSDEAKDLLTTLMLHVTTSPAEDGQRHLGRVRDILSLHPADLQDLLNDMAENGHPLVISGANRMMQKSEKELQSVVSTAVSNTHFLDSPSLRRCLEKSTFDFAQLKSDDNPLTVYLVIPAERLDTHGRWLRSLVSQATESMSRTKGKPKRPALFILDEFAALGRLATIERAFGLMAGFGMRIWAIVQDLSQPQDLYKNRWQTFIANAGVVQVFGTSDLNTAEYISRTLGQTTIEQISALTQERRTKGLGLFGSPEPEYRSMNDRTFARALATPDEIMKAPKEAQLLMISGLNPMWCYKLEYFINGRFYGMDDDGTVYPQFDPHPDYPAPSGQVLHADEYTRQRLRPKQSEPEQPAPRKKLFGLF